MKIYKSIEQQTVFDICVSIYGTLDRMVNLLSNNNLDMVSYIPPGTSVLYEDNVNPIGNFATNNGIYKPGPILPVIMINPTNPSAECGAGPKTMSISAAAGTNLSYQWQVYNGTTWINRDNATIDYSRYTHGIISGCTTSTISFFAMPGNYDNQYYRCSVSNDEGTVYSDGALFRSQNGYIISQPSDNSNINPTFSVEASTGVGGGIVRIHWEYNTTTDNSGFLPLGTAFPGFEYIGISGTFSTDPTSTLTLTGVTHSFNYYVRANVLANCGVIFSEPAQITY